MPLTRHTDPNLIAGMAQVGFDDPPVDDPASEALGAVIEATRAFSGRERYDDDFTLVVVRRDSAVA